MTKAEVAAARTVIQKIVGKASWSLCGGLFATSSDCCASAENHGTHVELVVQRPTGGNLWLEKSYKITPEGRLAFLGSHLLDPDGEA